MKIKSLLIFLLGISLFYTHSFANNSLIVDNTETWHQENQTATIEGATISVHPKGVYAEVGLYLTISARGGYLKNYGSLEIVLDFEMPKHSVINDSWLWIEGDIFQAEIIDKWSATEIYEEIVDRQQDPSVLYKLSPTQYQLRIYPLEANDARKIKINYLVPIDWINDKAYVPLPTNILTLSKLPVETISFRVFTDDVWGMPNLSTGLTQINFQTINEPDLEEYYQAYLSDDMLSSGLNLKFNAPLNENGFYAGYFESGDEKYYQLAMFPDKILDIQEPKKIVLLLDYHEEFTTIKWEDLLLATKSSMLQNLSPIDSFNIVYSDVATKLVHETWLAADEFNINTAFDILVDDFSKNFNNTASFLTEGIAFIQEHDNLGNLILIGGANDIYYQTDAIDLTNELFSMMGDKIIPISTINLQDKNYNYIQINNVYYRGNEYFYSYISKQTKGFAGIVYYPDVPEIGDLSSFIHKAILESNSYNSSDFTFDLYTDTEDGFCYDRYNLTTEVNNINTPIIQIGKYVGNLPLNITFNGFHKEEIFQKEYVITSEDVYLADSLCVDMWTGSYIQFMEGLSEENNVINEIIDVSIKERVLSKYTTFICLEPDLGGEPCLDCIDESDENPELVAVNEIPMPEDSVSITVYPNPFREQILLKVEFPEIRDMRQVSFTIYDINGAIIRTFKPASMNQTEHLISWNGENHAGDIVAKGLYYFAVETPTQKFTKSIMKL